MDCVAVVDMNFVWMTACVFVVKSKMKNNNFGNGFFAKATCEPTCYDIVVVYKSSIISDYMQQQQQIIDYR